MTTAAEPTENMTLAQWQARRAALAASLAAYDRARPTCRTCKHFSMGTCELHGDVPKEFQLTPEACESWAYDAIPF